MSPTKKVRESLASRGEETVTSTTSQDRLILDTSPALVEEVPLSQSSVDMTIESVVKSPGVTRKLKKDGRQLSKKSESQNKKSSSLINSNVGSELKTKRSRGQNGSSKKRKSEVSITATSIPVNSQDKQPRDSQGSLQSSFEETKTNSPGTIFCLFCDLTFPSNNKKQAAHHYWTHVEPCLLQDPSMKPAKFNRVYTLSTAWIQEVIQFFELSAHMDINVFNFRGCPVCRLLAPNVKKVIRKATTERDHMVSHLQYKKFLCKICLLDSDYEKARLGLSDDYTRNVSSFNSDSNGSQFSLHCLTPENESADTQVAETNVKDSLSSLDQVILQDDVLITVQSALHTIFRRGNTSGKSLKESVKANKRNVLKHIKDYHLSESPVGNDVLTSSGFDLMTRGVVEIEDLILEIPIMAVEVLINQLLVKPVSLLKKKTESVRVGDRVLTITREPCDPEVMVQDFRHSLLKPNFSFSPKLNKSQRKRASKGKAKSLGLPLDDHLEDLIEDSVGRLFPSPPYEPDCHRQDDDETLKSLPSGPEVLTKEVVTEDCHTVEPSEAELTETLLPTVKDHSEEPFQEEQFLDLESLKTTNLSFKDEHSYSKPSSPVMTSQITEDPEKLGQELESEDELFLTQLLDDLIVNDDSDSWACDLQVLAYLEESIREEYKGETIDLPILSASFVATFFGEHISIL